MTCEICQSEMIRHGKHRNRLQRYRCSRCGKTFTEPHQEPFRIEDHLREDRGLLAMRLLLEGNSVRAAERITGLHRRTILQVLVVAGARCETLLASRIKGLEVEDVQCDEIWGFCRVKGVRATFRVPGFPYVGDAWCFVAVERNTKLVLTFELGKRTETSTGRFMQKLSVATTGRFQLTTDGFVTYPTAVGRNLGGRVDYAQLIKIYAQTREGEARYSPPEVIEAVKKPVWGFPDEARICTSHVERQNLTLRMQVRRLTRLTNAFSKKWENLQAALALHFAWYNFCRVHMTLRATPAVKAGITDHAWDLGELLNG
jgi:transposase-like protein/IS1 family transposase